MMGKSVAAQSKLFYVGLNLEERMPMDHPLRRIAAVVDFGFVRGRVAPLYGVNGHESLDPALLLKLMFLVFYERVRSERDLMRQLPVRLDWVWFCGLDLDAEAPDHSVLSKARRRWGLEVFEAVFSHVLRQCEEAGLVDATTMYADSTVLQADASVESRVPRTLWAQMETGMGAETARPAAPVPPEDHQDLPPPPAGRFNARTVSTTDPDAATTARRSRGVTLGYRDHTLIDAKRGVVTATIATPADYDDAALLTPLLDKHRAYLGDDPALVAADSQYGTRKNFAALEARGVRPYLKPRPGKRGLDRWWDYLPKECRPDVAVRVLRRRQTGAEGRFADAHRRHEHRRCRWRRRWRVQIQCYLVAMVQNIRKLAKWGTNPGRAMAAAGAVMRRTGAMVAATGALLPTPAPPTTAS